MPVCYMCHEDNPVEAFAFRSLATGERQSHCRVCHAAYRRQHYLDNRATYIAREVARMNGYRIQNRLLIYEYLRAHPCVDCGASNPIVLEFDHRDRSQKRSEVARLASTRPWPVVFAEIQKCDVRCGNCHRRKTARDLVWSLPALLEQIRAEQAGPTWVSVLDDPAADAQVLQQCTGCKQWKPMSDFSIKNAKTGRRARRCKTCVAAYGRDHYRKNRPVYIAKAHKNRRVSRARNSKRKLTLLMGLSCVDCGESDPIVLEFDHRDRDDKRGDVSTMMANGWDSIRSEIEKCDIRCVNCHRRRTAQQFGWMKASLVAAVDRMEATRV
jgi:hypothetical protein